MKKFEILYFFDGSGTITIKANSREEAEDKFDNGEYEENDEINDEIKETYNYKIQEIKEL